MLKTCHILANYYPLYAAPFEYTRKLVKAGIDVDLVCLNRGSEPAVENIDGVQVTRINLPIRKIAATFRYLKIITKLLEQSHCDIVHVYCFRGCGILPLLSKKSYRKILIDIRSGSVSHQRFKSRLSNFMTRLEASTYDGIICVDQRVAHSVLGKKGANYIVPLGADFEKFKPYSNSRLRDEIGIKKNQIVVIFVSNLNHERNPYRVLKAFEKAATGHPQLVLLLVGAGSEMEEMRKMASKAPLRGKVIFAGQIPYHNVQEYLACGDIGLSYVPINGQYDLQPPLKTVEYLAAGLPMVATRTKGNMQFIRDDFNGVLVDDNEEAISQGICRLIEDSKLYNDISKEARRSVLNYDWTHIVKQNLLPAYKSMLKI